MSFKIRTERLIIRDLCFTDTNDLFSFESLPVVNRYLSHELNTIELCEQYINEAITSINSKPRQIYDLGLELSDRLIGRIGLRLKSASGENINETPMERLEAEMWFVLHPDHWGNGLATEAGKAILDYCFNNLNIHRVFVEVDGRNENSVLVAKKIGMTWEGQIRKNFWNKGEWTDSVILGILKEE
jgi:ribosomal-protein-alanine N-acetyltransferase